MHLNVNPAAIAQSTQALSHVVSRSELRESWNVMRLMAFCGIVSLAAPAQAEQPWVAHPLTVGETYQVRALDSQREINVALPKGYVETEASYPVVIMLDGGLEQDFLLTLGIERWNQLWQRSEPVILVGVQTVDRQKELLPPTQSDVERERYPTAGQASAFREWIVTELLPFLRSEYRTDGRAFLVGESAAGHFVIETWARESGAFSGFAAISPSLHWNEQGLAQEIAGAGGQDRPPLYISLADEGGATEAGLHRLLESAPANLCFSDRRDDLVHANSLHGLLAEALQYLLPTDADWLDDYGLTLRCDRRSP